MWLSKREDTYFVPWIIPCCGQIIVGNASVTSNHRGKKLIEDVIKKVTSEQPGAIVLGITKV